jgi:hypothetical protein
MLNRKELVHAVRRVLVACQEKTASMSKDFPTTGEQFAQRRDRQSPNRLTHTAASVAISMCLVAGTAHAQSVTGSIYGNAGSGGGVVVIENVETGSKVSVTPDANGRYSATTLPSGRYKVTLDREGKTTVRENIRVVVGQGTEVGLTGDVIESVVVYGAAVNAIDMSTVESKLTVTKELLDNVPVTPNLTSVALLAPGAVQGDSRYGNVPVFSGSSASENAYYINGFPVTQSLTQFGYTELPFNSIDQVQVSTGGYSVEFGRATGGVVSVNTSRGTNEWEFGSQILYRPEAWAGKPKNIYYGPNGRTAEPWGNAGQIYQYREKDLQDRQTLSLFASGPILRDRLFFYVAGEYIKVDGAGTEGGGGAADAAAVSANSVATASVRGWTEYEQKIPRWLGRLDWNITDEHMLSVTGFQDRIKEDDTLSGFDYATMTRNGVEASTYNRDRNTRTYVANYTGHVTDDLTISGMYGQAKTEYAGGPGNYNPDCPSILVNVGAAAPGLTYGNCQLSPVAGYLDGRFDETKSWRLDVEYQLGSAHTLKIGYDSVEAESFVGASNDGIGFPGALGFAFAGGQRWTYYRADDPNEAIYEPTGVGSPASAGGLGLQGFYVERDIGVNLSEPEATQRAQYIRDLWQVTDNVLIELGVRNEQFTNYNSAGVAYIDMDTQIAPRLGVTWDVLGDGSTKLYASAGRYHLAVPNNVSRRGADGATNTSEAFVYSGVDPATGEPTGLISLGSGPYSQNNEYGQSRDARSFAPTSLESHYQDTFAMGVEHEFNFDVLGPFNGGAKFTYSALQSAIDDFCDARPVYEWAQTNGTQYTSDQIDGLADFFGHCVLINPGEDNTYEYDIDGNGQYDRVHLSKELLRFPELERKYVALDLFWERPFDGKWYGRLDYTWSQSYGNLEGQLNSDIGQIDVSVTLAGDYWELAQNAGGYLPNDRRHQFKANGYYAITEEFMVSGALTVASGRPKNCRGAYPNIDPASPNYGSYHFFCDGEPAPRGSFGRLPNNVRFDLGARYTPQWAAGLNVGLNVYNVFNRQSVANVNELYNQGQSATTLHQNWGRVQSYTLPRYVELSLRYDFGM